MQALLREKTNKNDLKKQRIRAPKAPIWTKMNIKNTPIDRRNNRDKKNLVKFKRDIKFKKNREV